MKKNIMYISLVTAVAIFTGCGGGSGDGGDGGGGNSLAFTTIANQGNVNESTTKMVNLATNKTATFTENSENATISGSVLTFTAPRVDANTPFSVTVTAIDTSGNSATRTFTFTVTDVVDLPDVTVAPVGDKQFTNAGANLLQGPIPASTLIYRNTLSTEDGDKDYAQAEAYCTGSYRLPTRSEVFNIINYTKTSDINASLLDADFTANQLISTIWTSETDMFVNTVTGIDTLENNVSATHAIICIQGSSEMDHDVISNGATITDSTTGYIWEKVGILAEDAVDYATATASCDNGFILPTINDLRSIFDYSNNTLEELVPAGNAISVWSSTPYPKNADNQHYVMQLSNATGSITIADNTTGAHYVTCVKKP